MKNKHRAREGAKGEKTIGRSAPGFFTRVFSRATRENAFKAALARGIEDVAGSGIVRDPYEDEEECLATVRST